MIWVKAYVGSLLVFLALDSLWLGFAMRSFYPKHIGHLMRDSPSFGAAGAFYSLYIGGIVFLAVSRGLERESLAWAVLCGAILGLIAYGTFDMTNMAVLKDWPLVVTLTDVAWGTFLTAAAAAGGYGAARWGA